MTIKLNLDPPDRHAPVPADETAAPAHEAPMHGAITGSIAVGRYLLQVGEPFGAVLREASRAERAHVRPRPTPILLRPRLIRGLLDRSVEVMSALSALDANLPVEASGERGIGKTAFLRHLAHHPRAAGFVDGIVYVSARHQSVADLQQRLFEVFYESDVISKPTDAEIGRGLQEKRALILLDDVDLTQDELDRLLDIAPQSSFAFATRERCLWGETRSLALSGLPLDDALALFERELERALEVAERPAAANLSTAVGGHPLRIRQAAAIARQRGMSRQGWATNVTPKSLITELIASTDEKQRRALLALTALPGVPLQTQHIAAIAEVSDVEASLMTLVRHGLVVSSQSRHYLADGVADRLRRTDDLKPWANRAVTYFTAWAERHRRSAPNLLEESEALLRAQEHAAEARRWGEVIRLGRLVEGALIIGARWGAWAMSLERCLAAAKTTGDRSTGAWALHELGTRAVCLGDSQVARAMLSQAIKLRGALAESAGVAASRRTLGFILAPESEESGERPTLAQAERIAFDSLPLRDDFHPVVPVRKRSRAGALILTTVLCAMIGGAAHSAARARLSSPFWNLSGVESLLQRAIGRASPTPVSTTPASIVAFTARSTSITLGGVTELCYAVNGAVKARIEPGVGAITPTGALTCLRVAPERTTTYELTASGADGRQVGRQLVIAVR
jgi:NB-ARC domain